MPSLPRSSQSRSVRSSSIRSRRPSREQPASPSRGHRRRSTSPHHRTRSPHARPSASHPNRKRMGMNVYDNPARIGKFDFEEKYPEDPVYEELGPNARAWRVNLDECEVYDNDMVIEARDGLDLLLVFAGLFSAVLTTFVAQTSQALSNNFPAVSTSLLLEMVTLQRALINGTPIDDISSSEMTSGPSGFDVWVNALWFTSLTLSLGTALMAVLVKQWLYQYMSITSGTARDRSLIRFYRFDGLRKWHVLTIIGTLPIVLHVALGLFLAGLVVFLIPLNIPLSGIIGSITLVVYTMYAISNILPIIYTQCPYRTPFSDILNVLMRPIFTLLSSISSSAPAQALRTFLTSAITSVARLYKVFSTRIFKISSRLNETSSTFVSPKVVFPTLKDAERIAATSDGAAEGIAADALVWLHQMTSNTPTKSIVLQSLGCLSENVSDRLAVLDADLETALKEAIQETIYGWTIRPGQENCVERLLRAQRHVRQRHIELRAWVVRTDAFSPPFHALASILTYPPTQFVKCREMELWCLTSYDLVMYIIQEYSAGHPILLPPLVWRRFLVIISQHFQIGDTYNNLMLCQLALQSQDADGRPTVPPFSGGVPITHATVPLKHVVANILPHNDLPQSEPLRQLFIINDYIVSELSTDRSIVTDATPVILDIWIRIAELDDICYGDYHVIYRRAEKCILEVFVDGWWDGSCDTGVLNRCYSLVLQTYWRHGMGSGLYGVVPSPELFMKLFSELCWSTPACIIYMSHEIIGDIICRILVHALGQDTDDTVAYYTLLCGAESPLFSPRAMRYPLQFLGYMYRSTAAFISGLTRAYHTASHARCMEFLCDEPDRLYTVCRVLALGTSFNSHDKGEITNNVLKLAHLDPKRSPWQDRTHYLTGIEPWDWPYFSIPKDHGTIGHVRARMKFALEVLDDFFSSLENPLFVARVSSLRVANDSESSPVGRSQDDLP